jgi:hypothetical protein
MSCRATVLIFSKTLDATPLCTTLSLPIFSPACGRLSSVLFPPCTVVCLLCLPSLHLHTDFSVALSLRSFAKRRMEFGQFLSSNKSLTVSRYFRLMALAMTEIIFTTPLAIFMIWLNATATPIGPWRSWEDTHFAFSRVEQIPSIFWRTNRLLVVAFEFSRWVTPLCALVFFAFFGFADEAKRHYRIAFWWLAKPFGLSPATAHSSHNPPSIGYVFHANFHHICL